MEQSQAPQEQSIADIFVDTPPQVPTPQQIAPVEQVPAQVTAPVVEAPKPVQTVPLPELLETRHRAQSAEKEAQLLREQLAFIQRSVEAQRPQPQPIDPVADPEGAYRVLAHQVHEQAINQRANMSEMLSVREHGREKVDEAVQAAKKSGLNQHFMMQSDPYGALMSWHNNQALAQTVGPDLNAYKQKVRDEIIAEMRAAQAKPTVPQNLPPSLSTATNAANSVPVVKDSSDFFKEMLAKPTRA